MKRLVKIFALSLSLVLFWLPGTLAQPGIAAEKQTMINPIVKKNILNQFAQADVIYLGENHDRLAEHQAQLEIITALYQKNPRIAIAMEMFQRPFQPVIDRYLAGKIDETQLKQQTEYEQRWGYDWEYYAPILRFAKTHHLPVIALNTPTEITQKVAREGLESLSGDDFRYIPPIAEIKLDDRAYRQMLQKIYTDHAHNGHGNSDGFENFFAAQVLWDETMADAIASRLSKAEIGQFYQANSNQQTIVLVGQGHLSSYGIPQRVQRRIEHETFIQKSQLLEELVGF